MYKSSLVGKECEERVCSYLMGFGYIIVARNYHCPMGEIDIIASFEKKLCFVEVKSFSSYWPISDIGLKVPFTKQMRIKKTASVFLETDCHIKYDELRFDVATVCKDKVTYYEGAF